MTRTSAPSREHPSTRAASSSSDGIVSMYPRMIQITNGVTNDE